MKQKAIIILFTLLVVAAGVFLLFLIRYQGNLTAHGQGGGYAVLTPIPDPEAVPAFAFVDHDGVSFGHAELQGDWTLLFFGFTNCPDICSPTMTLLKAFIEQLDEQDPTPRVVFVSVDPERDTPSVLKRYVTAFHQDFVGIVGPRPALIPLAQHLGIYAQRAPSTSAMSPDEAGGEHAGHKAHPGHDAPSEDYVINHSGYVLIIDPQGRYVGVFSPPLEVEKMSAAWRDFAG